MSEELKIGQRFRRPTWMDDERYIEIITLGPEYVGLRMFDSPLGERVAIWKRDDVIAALLPIKPKHELWVNVYRNQHGHMWSDAPHSRELAEEAAGRRGSKVDRIACLKIEFTEGEGL